MKAHRDFTSFPEGMISKKQTNKQKTSVRSIEEVSTVNTWKAVRQL